MACTELREVIGCGSKGLRAKGGDMLWPLKG